MSHSRSPWLRRLRIAAIAMIVAFTLCAALRRQLVTVVVQRAFSTPKTVLFVGTNGKLADTVIVGYFGTEKNASPRLLIISRDTEVEGHKINSYWPQGPAKFKARIEGIMGHRIDNFVAIPFEKMPQLLDEALPQGLSVELDYRLKYADKQQNFAYDVPRGRHTLNTHDLMALLRDRYSDPLKRGDASRAAHWRKFFIEFRNEYLKPKNLLRVSSLANTAQKIVQSDMTSNEMGGVLASFVTNDFSTNYLPISSRYDEAARRWVTTLDAAAAKRQGKLLMKGVVVPPKTRLWVLNSTGDAGLSRRFAASLRRDLGITTSFGNAAPGTALGRSTVEFSSAELVPLAAEVGASVLKGAKAPVFSGNTHARSPLIVVTLGADAR